MMKYHFSDKVKFQIEKYIYAAFFFFTENIKTSHLQDIFHIPQSLN